jgi:hypothetical protein
MAAGAGGPAPVDLTDPADGAAAMQAAMGLVSQVLGPSWLIRELDERATARGGLLMLDDPRDDPDSNTLRQSRLVDLATELNAARQIRGFAHVVAELRARSLYEVVAELRGVRLAAEASENIWFNDPNASEGPSPDATAVQDGQEVAIEVKSKLEQPAAAFRPGLITNTLESARKKQLPADSPSIIYLQIGAPWAEDEAVLARSYEACEHFLRRTGRVNAVILMLEKRLVHDRGVRVLKSNVAVINRRARFPLPGLQGWLDEPGHT